MNNKRVWLGLCCISGLSCASQSASSDEVERVSAALGQKVDLLLVVDNSSTMLEEQSRLVEQVPRLVEILTTGMRSVNDPEPFEPVRDLHVGVVSSDLGMPGITTRASCAANGGEKGRLRHSGARALDATCPSEFPTFLRYEAGRSDPRQFAHDVRCIAEIGAGGCSEEQPLEAALQALTPGGLADLAPELGGNAGFLRNDPADLSLLVVLVLTDEDDCSIADTRQLSLATPGTRDPDLGEDVNPWCISGTGLHDVRERYLKGLRALRPGHEELVVFVAIAGIPPDLVFEDVLAKTDFSDPLARDLFYDSILKDSRMQPGFDVISPRELGLISLHPSCVAPPNRGEDQPHLAFPAPRLVELAKSFGENGMVQSICSDDVSSVVDPVLRAMTRSKSR